MTLWHLIPFGALLGHVVLAGLTFSRRGRRDNVGTVLLLVISFCLSFWIAADLMSFFSLGPLVDSIVVRIGALGWILASFGLFFYGLHIAGVRDYSLYWSLLGLCGLTAGVAVFTDYIHVRPAGGFAGLKGEVSFLLFWSGGVTGGEAIGPVAGMSIAYVLIAIFLIGRKSMSDDSEYDASVLRAVCVGAGVSLSLMLIAVIAVPSIFDIPGYSRFGSSSGIVMGVAVYWAIRRADQMALGPENLVDEILGEVREGIVTADPGGRVHGMSNRARVILGLGDNQTEKLNLGDLLPDCPLMEDNWEKEIFMITEGQRRNYAVSGTPLLIRELKVGELVVLSDVTEQKKTACTLNTLSEIVEQRTEQSKLYSLRRDKNEALGTLAGGIAHDFMNLLAAILGFTSVVQDEIGPEHPIQSDLKETMRAAQRTKKIVEQILSFCRKEEYDYEQADLRTVVEEAIGLLRVSLPSTVRIDYSPPERSLEVECDKSELIRVIIALGVNAERAMSEGGGEFSISLERIELGEDSEQLQPPLKSGSYAVLVVQDTGVGISGEDLPKIFDPFFTHWKDNKATSAGLGLSAADGIIEAHRGSVNVESELGVGTRFTVFLPLVN